MDETERETIEAKEALNNVTRLSYSTIVVGLLSLILAISGIPGAWVEKTDSLQQFTLTNFCTRTSTSAAFTCGDFTAFSIVNASGVDVTGAGKFTVVTPDSVTTALATDICQVVLNAIALVLIVVFFLGVGEGKEPPLGNVSLVTISSILFSIAFLCGLVAMLAVAGDARFRYTVWTNPATRDSWNFGSSYGVNIAAWVSTLVAGVFGFTLRAYALPEDDEDEAEGDEK